MLREILEKLKLGRRKPLAREIDKILQRVDAMPTLDNRSADEILGYDEHGLLR